MYTKCVCVCIYKYILSFQLIHWFFFLFNSCLYSLDNRSLEKLSTPTAETGTEERKGEQSVNVSKFPVCQLIRELCFLCIVFSQTKSIQGWEEIINEYRILMCLELIISRAGSNTVIPTQRKSSSSHWWEIWVSNSEEHRTWMDSRLS